MMDDDLTQDKDSSRTSEEPTEHPADNAIGVDLNHTDSLPGAENSRVLGRLRQRLNGRLPVAKLIVGPIVAVWLILWSLTRLDVISLDVPILSKDDEHVDTFDLTYRGLTEDLRYHVRIWPQYGDWTGEAVERSFIVSNDGTGRATWKDTNDYEIRYGNDASGWTEWLTPADLPRLEAGLLAESAAVQALAVDSDVEIEMRPAHGPPSAVPTDYLRIESEAEALVYLLWPNWTSQVRSSREEDWRAPRAIPPENLTFDFSDVELVCLRDGECQWALEQIHSNGRSTAAVDGSLGGACVLRS